MNMELQSWCQFARTRELAVGVHCNFSYQLAVITESKGVIDTENNTFVSSGASIHTANVTFLDNSTNWPFVRKLDDENVNFELNLIIWSMARYIGAHILRHYLLF